MKKSSLMVVWGIFYIICAGLGFIPEPEGAVRIFLTAISVLFFVPPAILLFDAFAGRDRKTVLLIRRLAALSLGVTLVLLIANFLAALGGEWLGSLLHVLLVLCSAPMFCSNYWVLSLFLWAVLLVASMQKWKEK
ncbi:MAG: hypothetical protein ACI3XG_04785 [Faecousia sp.]